jgi:hypothetical protein
MKETNVDANTKEKCCKCDRVAKHWIRFNNGGELVEVPMCCYHYSEITGGSMVQCLSDGGVE